MKTQKMLSTLLFAMLISVALFGCDNSGTAGSGASGAASQPTTTTASNPPPSGNSSASPTTSSASSSGDVKLTVSYTNYVWSWCKTDGRDKSAPLRILYTISLANWY